MIRVNTLIQNALQRVGIVGDGQPANENQSTAALTDLHAVICDLNLFAHGFGLTLEL